MDNRNVQKNVFWTGIMRLSRLSFFSKKNKIKTQDVCGEVIYKLPFLKVFLKRPFFSPNRKGLIQTGSWLIRNLIDLNVILFSTLLWSKWSATNCLIKDHPADKEIWPDKWSFHSENICYLIRLRCSVCFGP